MTKARARVSRSDSRFSGSSDTSVGPDDRRRGQQDLLAGGRAARRRAGILAQPERAVGPLPAHLPAGKQAREHPGRDDRGPRRPPAWPAGSPGRSAGGSAAGRHPGSARAHRGTPAGALACRQASSPTPPAVTTAAPDHRRRGQQDLLAGVRAARRRAGILAQPERTVGPLPAHLPAGKQAREHPARDDRGPLRRGRVLG